eukprot:7031612-Prymnesium_polylepis.1
MDRMARSATPLSSWTCGEHVDCATLSSRSRYSRDRNSPALSVWIDATLKREGFVSSKTLGKQ